MKHFLLTLFLCLISISPLFAQEEAQPLSAEKILSEIQAIEQFLDGCDRMQLEGEDKILLKKATTTWETFKELCGKSDFEEAICFYQQNFQDFWVYLFNTSAQFYFTRTIIKHLAFQSMSWEEAYDLYRSDLELNLIMTEGVIEMAKEKKGYVPQHYADLTHEMIGLYMEGEEWEKAHEIVDHYVDAIRLVLDFTKFSCEASRLYVESIIFEREGKTQKAKETAESGLKYVLNVKEDGATPENVQGYRELFEQQLQNLK